MYPWGHLALGYVLYSVTRRLAGQSAPNGRAAVWLALGTQFPDGVDKPLAWYAGALPNGRSLTHSALTAAVLVVLVLAVTRSVDRIDGAAFAAGYVSHLFGDALRPLVAGDFGRLAFLLWPLVPPLEYPTEGSLGAHLQHLPLDGAPGVELAFGFLVALLWVRDGAPGLGIVRSAVSRRH
jgi:hypothetical protein